MIKRILYCFLWSMPLAQAFTVSDCQSHGEPEWFCEYMKTHNREYESKQEALARKERVSRAFELRKAHGDVFGLTSKSDHFPKELKSNNALVYRKHVHLKRSKGLEHKHLGAPQHLSPIDWRNVNGRSYVTSIKDQGECGCCFAFASATVLEYWSKINGFPKSLSPQSLMDCTSGSKHPDEGCEGGLMEYVFEYAKRHPVPLDVDSPYLERTSICPNYQWSHVRVKNYKVLMKEDSPKAESEIEWLLHAYGPVSVGVDSTSMEHYRGGLFKASMCSKEIDHAVTIVGYTEDAWIIKNSWGPYWGDEGYLYLERGKNACGVAEYIVYITDAEPIMKELSTYWWSM